MVEEVYKVVINGEIKYVSTKEEAERLEKEAKENEDNRPTPSSTMISYDDFINRKRKEESDKKKEV